MHSDTYQCLAAYPTPPSIPLNAGYPSSKEAEQGVSRQSPPAEPCTVTQRAEGRPKPQPSFTVLKLEDFQAVG